MKQTHFAHVRDYKAVLNAFVAGRSAKAAFDGNRLRFHFTLPDGERSLNIGTLTLGFAHLRQIVRLGSVRLGGSLYPGLLAEREYAQPHPLQPLMHANHADILRTLTSAEALALLERCDIPCAPVNQLDALIDDPHLAAVGFFQTRAHPTEGRIRYTGIPSRWNGHALTIRRHAPRTGEHSLAVLKEAGLPAREIAALLHSGATLDGAMKAKAVAAQ